MARTINRVRALHGRFYDFGRMTLPEVGAAMTCPAIQLHAVRAQAGST